MPASAGTSAKLSNRGHVLYASYEEALSQVEHCLFSAPTGCGLSVASTSLPMKKQ